MSDLLQVTPDGLYCPPGRFHVDPWRPVKRAVITHGHADHARGGSARYLGVAEGTRILKARLGHEARIEEAPWGEERSINGVRVSFHPAGHVRGSAQVRVEHRGEVWVVSGDYKLEADPTASTFEPVRCHTFVSECTFGLPVYRWPDPAEVFAEIHDWWATNQERGRTCVLFAYSLGKAQRILAHLDPSQGPLLAHGAIRRMSQVYRDDGVALPELGAADGSTVRALKGAALVLAPPSTSDSTWLRSLGPTSAAFASGWMRIRGTRRRRGVDRGFVISDHADWDGLLTAIGESGASRVELTHGTTGAMTRFLTERGLDARALATRYEGEGGAGEDAADAADADGEPAGEGGSA